MRTWAMMKKTDTPVIGFNFSHYDTTDARKATRFLRQKTDGWLAWNPRLSVQTSWRPGAGKTFWVKDRGGVEIPVVTARHLLSGSIPTRIHGAGRPRK